MPRRARSPAPASGPPTGPDAGRGADKSPVLASSVDDSPAVRSSGAAQAAPEHEEQLPPHASAHLLSTSVSRLNRLRAAVLGGTDGLTSPAGLVGGGTLSDQ